MILSGDWWQLKPVAGTSLHTDPRIDSSIIAAHGLQLMWNTPPNCVHRVWDFQESLRCTDKWFNEVLKQCRNGQLTDDSHSFLHGFPTKHPALLGTKACTCTGKVDNNGFYVPWAEQFLKHGASGQDLLAMECKACQLERSRRRRVIRYEEDMRQQIGKPFFDTAPALYAFNVPR